MSRFSSLLRPLTLRPATRLALASSLRANTPLITSVRFGSGRPDKTVFETRALELLKGFEKVPADKVRH
jgi:hypothetical protein